MKNIQIIATIILVFLLSSCSSVKKYNEQVSKKHSPDELKKDVDYAYKRLIKLHPKLYLYISKEYLDYKFDSLKNKLNKPLTSVAFYKQLAPVITSIKQGHTSLKPPFKKQTKIEKQEKGKRVNPFNSIEFKKINDKVVVEKTFGTNNTILIGSEVLAIDNNKTSDLINSFKNLYTGDGYNKTFVPEFTRKYIGNFYLFTHGLKDSIQLSLKYKDSLYNKYIYAFEKKLEKETTPLKRLSKAEKKILKEKEKARKEWESKYGYNKYTKENTRNLKIIISDSTNNTSYLKIRSFSKGNYKDFYKEAFMKIDSAKSTNLIIDLRDNLGGRGTEVNELFSYLTNKEYYLIKPFEMTKASSWMYPYLHSKSTLIKSVSILLYPIAKIAQIFLVKNIDGKPHISRFSKLREPKKEYNYNGNIYVLINGISFSSSSLFSSNLKGSNRAFFVGDETGGGFSNTVAGQFVDIELPNSKLNLQFGLYNFKIPYEATPKGYGVKPDKYIEVKTLDKDEQLEWILKDIKSGNKNFKNKMNLEKNKKSP